MADVINNFSSLANDAPNVMITRRMFELAERNLAIAQFAQEYTLENYMSKTMRIVRYNRFGLPTTQLVEGVPPDSVPLSFTFVDVVTEQWGIVALLTDVGMLTITHPILQIAMERCALAISELVERQTAMTLLNTGTSVIYGNAGVTTRASIVNTGTPKTDRLTTATLISATVQLRARGAPYYDGSLYGVVIQPQQEGDLLASDTVFQNSSNFARVRKLENAEIGIYMGGHFVRGNFLPIFAGVAAPDGSASTATKGQVVISNSGGSLTRAGAGNYQVVFVARELTSDYERRISQNSANLTLGAAVTTGSITATTPTSTNYVYDIYLTREDLTIPYRVRSRVAANTSVILTAVPTGTETIAPVAPSSGTEVFMAWSLGKDAYARVKLNQMSMQSYITPAGASWENPLAQGRKVGTKIMFNTAIQDQTFLTRIETVSGYPAFLPA
jgi:N4-gp56 family major capsid protein